MKKTLLLGLGLSLALVTGANAAPLAAPDTTDIIATITAFGLAGVAVRVAWISFPIAISALKRFFA